MSRDILPDSRARETKGIVQTKTVLGLMIPVYCANCGADGGLCPEKNMTFMFYLCNKCFEDWGEIAGTMAQPDQVFWAQVKADQEGARQQALERGDLVLHANGEADQADIKTVGNNGILHP